MSNRIDEIKTRLQAATQGPWGWDDDNRVGYLYGLFNDLEVCKVVSSRMDAELIANASSDIAYLLEENERLQKVLKFYATESNWTGGWYQEGGNPDAEPDWINPAVDSDGGKLARQTLSVKVDGQ